MADSLWPRLRLVPPGLGFGTFPSKKRLRLSFFMMSNRSWKTPGASGEGKMGPEWPRGWVFAPLLSKKRPCLRAWCLPTEATSSPECLHHKNPRRNPTILYNAVEAPEGHTRHTRSRNTSSAQTPPEPVKSTREGLKENTTTANMAKVITALRIASQTWPGSMFTPFS